MMKNIFTTKEVCNIQYGKAMCDTNGFNKLTKWIKVNDIIVLKNKLQLILMNRYQDKPESRGLEPFINYLYVQRIIDDVFEELEK